MHSVADRFYPSQNSISEVMHSDALYVHLGHRPMIFIMFFYRFLFPVHQMIFWHAFLKHNIPLQVIYTSSFYKCLRTTYYNANLSISWRRECKRWFRATSYETSVVKWISSCGVQSVVIVLNLLCRGRSFWKAFLGEWENPFFFLKTQRPFYLVW